MRFFLTFTFIFLCTAFFTQTVFAIAPLDGKYAQAPAESASRAEKARASSEARKKVIEASKKYLGTPYVYGGMNSRGVDCSGFTCLSFKDALNVSLPRSAAGQYSWAEKISLEKAQPGDLLFFRTMNTSDISHVALYLGNRLFIHAASAGEKTGVIYSSLDERYWAAAFAGAGRALPEAASGFNVDSGSATAVAGSLGEAGGSYFYIGAALAPSWDFFMVGGSIIRGFTSQIFFNAEFSKWLAFGIELRPEYDGMLGVLRLPLTLSWGHKDLFRVFAGPVLSVNLSDKTQNNLSGEASFSYNNETRNYSGGTSWIGMAGVTFTPFNFKITRHQISPYMELAWQSYFNNEQAFNFSADFTAAFRFALGLKWKMCL